MQSIFRLPWSSDQFGLGAADKVRFGKDIAPSRSDVSVIKQNKRKRALTSDSENAPRSDVKKSRPATASNANHVSSFTVLQAADPRPSNDSSVIDGRASQSTATSPTAAMPTKLDATVKSKGVGHAGKEDVQMTDASTEIDVASERQAKLCQAIENQINLQILLKHNEMRLIDQELAKCQIALEQLRRCELRPYPGSDGFEYNVSSGTGSAVQPEQGFTVPTHAPPHGVVDGPYTRHYRQWLLPDPQFDPEALHAVTSINTQLATARAGRAGRKIIASGAYGSPHRHDFPGLPQPATAPVPKKDNNMPLVLRRSTDGKMVKLVCNNCNRGNMSSIQGFLNHCRIAHKVVYESHDAAAQDCGRVLDEQELASLPAETQAAPAPKPVVRHVQQRTQSIVMAPPAAVSVHPLNAPSAKVKSSKPSSRVAKPVSSSTSAQSAQHAASPFNPAAALPRLSALFARKQAGGDLEQAVADAQSRPDFASDEIASPASLTPGSPAIATPTSGRGGLSAAGNAHRVHGGKGRSQMAQHSYFAPPQTGSEHHDNAESPREMNLSPHAVDSNPGLVSDLEDDDNGSASEEESSAPHHPLSHPLGMNTSCGESMDIAVAEEDGVVHHGGVVIRRNSTLSADDRGLRVVGTSSNKLGGNQAL